MATIKKLLRIEFLKLFSFPGFWVMMAIHCALFLLVTLIASQIEINMPGINFHIFFQFPNVWGLFAWIASWFNLFLAILFILITGNEFSFRTFRQHVIDGLSRNELIYGKLLVIGVVSLYNLILVFLTTLVYGFIFSNNTEFSVVTENMSVLLVYFLQAIAYMTFGMMLVIIMKNIALTIVAYFVWFFPIEPIIRNLFPEQILLCFPMKVISNLTPPPDVMGMTMKTTSQFNATVNNGQMNMQNTPMPIPDVDFSIYANAGITCLYVLLFIGISLFIVNRRNL